jgi:hypothetical protein
MGRPRSATKTSRFSALLDSHVASLIAGGDRESHGDTAKELRIGATRLSKLLTHEGPVSAASVALICSRVNRRLAAELLKAYLLDHADVVTEISAKEGFLSLKADDNIRVSVKIENVAVD